MATTPKQRFPGGSRERVNRAGNNVRNGDPSDEDLEVIEVWRAAHRPVLNTFQSILRNRTRGKRIIVAQRHKRKRTIFGKLRRYPRMQLARMDDVAGCRLIFRSIEELRAFRQDLHNARFKHKLKNDENKYDYIARPKNTGYRGVHDVYEYDVNSIAGQAYKGLLIELQYRTVYQHAWATCVEVIGHITQNQPKFEEGDERYLRIMALASEIIARAFEDMRSSMPGLSDEELVEQFLELDHEIHLMPMLRGLNAADRDLADDKNVILIFGESDHEDELEVRTFRDATDALRALFELESENPGKDIVLVRADTSDDVREAFKNYFSDARDFIHMIDEGCESLMEGKVLRITTETDLLADDLAK